VSDRFAKSNAVARIRARATPTRSSGERDERNLAAKMLPEAVRLTARPTATGHGKPHETAPSKVRHPSDPANVSHTQNVKILVMIAAYDARNHVIFKKGFWCSQIWLSIHGNASKVCNLTMTQKAVHELIIENTGGTSARSLDRWRQCPPVGPAAKLSHACMLSSTRTALP